ncbi:MAG: dehydratase [Planctomycetota bacterium]|nr:MAG: dehydratase [Planctomycetota bacterium]
MPAAPNPRAPIQVPGRTFDELETGLCFLSPARTITEADIVLFAGLSGDMNPLHIDAESCKRTPFRQRIAHGMLIQSVATGLGWQTGLFHGTIQALQQVSVRFEKPVLAGDTIQLALTVAERDPAPTPRRGWVRFATRVTNQHGESVSEGEWMTLMSRRPAKLIVLGERDARAGD